MKLKWSKEKPPGPLSDGTTCNYTHVYVETPVGLLVISWKGWKEYPMRDCLIPWSDKLLTSPDLDDLKSIVQEEWETMATAVLDLTWPLISYTSKLNPSPWPTLYNPFMTKHTDPLVPSTHKKSSVNPFMVKQEDGTMDTDQGAAVSAAVVKDIKKPENRMHYLIGVNNVVACGSNGPQFSSSNVKETNCKACMRTARYKTAAGTTDRDPVRTRIRKVIELRGDDNNPDLSYAEIGRIVGLSSTRVRAIIIRNLWVDKKVEPADPMDDFNPLKPIYKIFTYDRIRDRAATDDDIKEWVLTNVPSVYHSFTSIVSPPEVKPGIGHVVLIYAPPVVVCTLCEKVGPAKDMSCTRTQVDGDKTMPFEYYYHCGCAL